MIELGIRVARPGDYDSIVAVVDHWWERPVCPSLPRLFLDHFWSTSRIARDQQEGCRRGSARASQSVRSAFSVLR